jgi:hypothetical protein
LIDPSLGGLCSAYDTFGVDIGDSADDVGWNYILEKPIPQSKLCDLIVCLAFFLDGLNIKVKDSTATVHLEP